MVGAAQRFQNLHRFSQLPAEADELPKTPETQLRQIDSSNGGLKRHLYRAILAIMRKASITEAENTISALIDSVGAARPC